MRSLRARLGVTLGLVGLLLTLGSGAAIAYERWQEESTALRSDVELEAFRLSEIERTEAVALEPYGGTDWFALVYDDEGQPVATLGSVDDEALEFGELAWEEALDSELAVTFDEPLDGGRTRFVSAVGCLDETTCDTVVVGAASVTLWSYVGERIGWILLPALLVGVAGLVVARWLVGRALRPVEAMRAELDAITTTGTQRRVPVSTSRDEIQHLGETLNTTLDRLQAASQATERFAADAAHELRSPITGARAAVELRAGDDELLNASLDELDRASVLIDDLLLLARSEGRTPSRVDVDLDEIASRVASAARTRHPDAELTTSLQPVRVLGDPAALERVLTNVVDNAVLHGGGRVDVSVVSEGGFGRITVDDDGPGIAVADRRRVFERFSRLDASRSRRSGGAGLGLAMVEEIVTAHGGGVTIEDAPLGGARFVLSVPSGTAGGTRTPRP